MILRNDFDLLRMPPSTRTLIIGDPHLRIGAANREWCAEVIKIALEQAPYNFIVVMGDVFHTHETMNSQILNIAIAWIVKMAKIAKTFMLVGNHDFIDNQQFLTDNHSLVAFKYIPNVQVCDRVVVDHEFKSVFVPYVPNGRFKEALGSTSTAIPQDYEIYAHQEFKGAKFGGRVSEDGDARTIANQIWSGHIHTPQKLGDIEYVGSGNQTSIDDPPPGIVVKTGRVLKRMPLTTVPYTVPKTVSVDELAELADADELVKAGATATPVKYKITIHLKTQSDLKALRLTPEYLKLEKKHIINPIVDTPNAPTYADTGRDIRDILKEKIAKEKDSNIASVFERLVGEIDRKS